MGWGCCWRESVWPGAGVDAGSAAAIAAAVG